MTSRVRTHVAIGATLMAVAGCTTDRPAPTAVVVRAPIFERRAETDAVSRHKTRHLETDLRGRNEVPPHKTPASGEAEFRVHGDGSVSYKLFVDDITNPFMAHIHIAARGVNGPVVVWLFPSTTPGQGPANSGLHEGLLAAGTFTGKDLVGPLKNGTLAQLLDSIRVGHAYVNVHTSNGTTTAGPGNFQGGEIRGQLGPRHTEKQHADDEE